MAKRKRTNQDLQNTTQKTKDRAMRTPLKHWGWTLVNMGSDCIGRCKHKYHKIVAMTTPTTQYNSDIYYIIIDW